MPDVEVNAINNLWALGAPYLIHCAAYPATAVHRSEFAGVLHKERKKQHKFQLHFHALVMQNYCTCTHKASTPGVHLESLLVGIK